MRYFLIFLVFLSSVLGLDEIYYIKNGKKSFLKPVVHVERNLDKDFYKNENDLVVGVDNTLLVRFLDTKNMQKYIKKYNIKQSKKIVGNLYKFSLYDKSQTLRISNELSLKKDVKYAHPNFYRKRISR